MSRITGTETLSLMEAYQAVYNDDLREELEEEREVEWVSFQIIENAAYVLFSQGYDVDDVISYFTEASQEVIVEDAISISEGVLLVESVAVSDEYIAEQFELLYERVPGLGWLASQAGRAANAVKGVVTSVKKSAETYNRAKNIQKIRDAKTAVPPGKAKVTTGSGGTPPTGTAKVTTTGGNAVGRNVFQKAGDFAKTQLGKLPGAKLAGRIAKSPVGKIAGKALPGLGAAAYGIDAADRAKKGDWGGAALSGLGAVTSAIPGVGLVGGLAPAAIQMGTDALGLTGDKSKKGSAKPTPAGPPSLKAKQDFAKSKGKYYSSSDQKTYKNYNDALAAKNSRRGVKPTPTPPEPPKLPEPSSSSQGSSSSPAPAASSKPASTPAKPSSTPDTKLTDMQKWAKANPNLASRVKPGQSGYDEISAKRDKPGPNEKQDQTPTQGNPDAKIDPKAVSDALKAQQDRDKKKVESASTTKESYDAYDILLDYLVGNGHVDTLEEAHYIMLEMDTETVGSIIEAAADQSDKQIDKGVKSTYKAQNVLDNQHQGRSKGLNKLPRGEREKKAKRMRGRLKSRRDDLFGERNKREDSKREQLKKMLGL
jgi:hypothetical protein